MVPEIPSATDRFFVILDMFLPIYPPKNPENKNFEKMKNTPGCIIILHKCTKIHDHMLYCSWDMACDGCNCYFSIWTTFCSFTTLTCLKNENFKKMEKASGDVIILHKCTKNYDHILYCSWDMVRDGCNCYFSFWAIFALLPP